MTVKGTRFWTVFLKDFALVLDKMLVSSDQDLILINRRQITQQVHKTLNCRLKEHAFPGHLGSQPRVVKFTKDVSKTPSFSLQLSRRGKKILAT